MPYYDMKKYNLAGFRTSRTKNKMYDAIIQDKETKKNKYIPFGDNRYENFRDITGLNSYPHLIHGYKERRRLYKIRHMKDIKKGFYSAGYFSMKYLW